MHWRSALTEYGWRWDVRTMFCRLWNVAGDDPAPEVLHGHSDSVIAIAFSSDGRWLVTGSRDKTAKLWNLEAGGQSPGAPDPLEAPHSRIRRRGQSGLEVGCHGVWSNWAESEFDLLVGFVLSGPVGIGCPFGDA